MSDSNVIGFPHGPRPGDPLPYQEPNPNEAVKKEPDWLPRQLIMIEAEQAIMGARHQTHGSAESNLEMTGDLWTKFIGKKIDGHDVALLNVLQKISRILCGERTKDHYKDIIGWAALAWERSDNGNVGG